MTYSAVLSRDEGTTDSINADNKGRPESTFKKGCRQGSFDKIYR